MLYFAFGSNLHHKQMKRRCKDSKYLGCYTLKGYKLNFRNYYFGGGVAPDAPNLPAASIPP